MEIKSQSWKKNTFFIILSLVVLILINLINAGWYDNSDSNQNIDYLDSNLVLFYSFNESSGTNVPEIISGLADGTINNGDSDEWISGVLGNAIDLDGGNDYIIITNESSFDRTAQTDNFSISVWVNLDVIPNTGAEEEIATNENNWRLYYFNHKIRFSQYDGAGAYHNVWTTKNNETEINGWNHIVLVYNGTGQYGLAIYINGTKKELTYTSYDGGWTATGTDTFIGVYQDEAYGWFDGSIDELGIWRRSLNSTEVSKLYDSGGGLYHSPNPPVYSLEIRNPTTGNAKSVSDADNITIRFNFQESGVNLTTGVTMNNVTIGGEYATINNRVGTGDVPNFIGAGSIVSDISPPITFAPTCPTHQLNDILIVSGYSTDNSLMTTATSGWVEIDNLDGGSSDDAVWWWKRAPGSGTAGPTITAPDDDVFAICYVFRGIIITGYPFDATWASQNNLTTSTDTNAPVTAGIETLGINRLAVHFLNRDDDTTFTSGYPPAGWVGKDNQNMNSGTDATFTVISKNITSQGNVASVTVATGASIEKSGGLTLAFIPAAGGTEQVFDYTAGIGWQVNVTVPSGLSGLQDLFLNATYNGNTRNDTQTNAISYPGGDDIYPDFSDYYDDNASVLDTGIGHFNVTVENTNGTVYLWINNTKTYATNLSADNYNVSFAFTQAGNYMYNWTAYGNGSSNNENISSSFYYTVNASETSVCKTLNTANEVYTLNNDVSSTGTCFTVSATNVTINCKGHRIKYSTNGGSLEFGVTATSQTYTKVSNCMFEQGTEGGTTNHGLYLNADSHSVIRNNTFNVSNAYGILIDVSGNNISILNNRINVSNSPYSSAFDNCDNCLIQNNVINGSDSTNYHWFIDLFAGSENSVVRDNVIYGHGNKLLYGIDTHNHDGASNNNEIINNTITFDYAGFGLLDFGGTGNDYINNTITLNADSGIGLNITQGSTNGIYIGNIIKHNANSGAGIAISSCTNAIINNTDIRVTGSSTDGIQVASGTNTFNVFNSIVNSSQDEELNFISGVTGTWNFTNVSKVDGNKLDADFNGAGNFNNHWYLNVNVSNSTGLMYDANVTIRDRFNTIKFSGTTNVNGEIAQQTIYESLRNTTGSFYYTPHDINVTETGFTSNSTIVNFTSSYNKYLKIFMNIYTTPDTCSYTSGNWAVNCADYCNITTNIDGGGNTNNFTAIGSGWFKINANISGFLNYKFSSGCQATCLDGGCIKI